VGSNPTLSAIFSPSSKRAVPEKPVTYVSGRSHIRKLLHGSTEFRSICSADGLRCGKLPRRHQKPNCTNFISIALAMPYTMCGRTQRWRLSCI
jgi:hypothetical protein